MSGEKPWGRECLYMCQVFIRIEHLDERNNLLRMTGEEWVVVKVIPRAAGNCEGESFKPCGSTLGIRSKDDVVRARFEAILDAHNVLSKLLAKPIVLI
jgi:hypothetical protein